MVASSASGQAKSSAVIRAQEVLSNLGPEFPSFVKSLVRSHVASCFWMVSPVILDESEDNKGDMRSSFSSSSFFFLNK